MLRNLALVVTVIGLPASLAADVQQGHSRHSLHRLTAGLVSDPIVVDGRLTEPAWNQAVAATNFIQSEPNEGEPATEQTEVKLLTDGTTLYIGFSAYDTQADEIVVGELKKDFNPRTGDAFEVIIDTFLDRRNGYIFATNPMGAKWDAQMMNEGREVNSDWDAIWRTGAHIDANGWYAELAIPLHTLRFSNTDSQTWGINFLRRLHRRKEESYWAPVPRHYRITRVSLAGTLENLRGLRGGTDLRIKPYMLASGTQLFTQPVVGDTAMGLDLKYGLTAGLTLDMTINTDFSQVESDEQQINLTRVSLFFPEKREFFLENSGVFQFGPGNERGQGRSRIRSGLGASSSFSRLNEIAQPGNDLRLFFSRRIGLDDSGEAIPILGGLRLTGNTGRYSVGVMNIHQGQGPNTPATNFSAVRIRRALLANSDVGVAMLNKQTAEGHYNRVFGADANFRFFQHLNLNAYVAKTLSPPEVTKESGSDLATRIGLNYPGSFWMVRASYLTIGDQFNNELGFVPRVGIGKFDGFLGAHVRPKSTSRWAREFFPHWEGHRITRRSGQLDSAYYDHHLMIRFQNGGMGEIGINQNVEVLTQPFTLHKNRGIVLLPARYDYDEFFLWYNPDPGTTIGLTGRFAIGEFYSGHATSYRIGSMVRATARFNAHFSLTRNLIRLPEGSFNTDLLATRINVDFSTRTFLNALIQYNSAARQWSSNVRFNIIHRPLSDIFVVYNDQRNSQTGWLMNRSLVVKMTYLVSF